MKKYTASEWLRICSNERRAFAVDHYEACQWYWWHSDSIDGRVYSYTESALIAESAEWSDRAIGIKPVRTAAFQR